MAPPEIKNVKEVRFRVSNKQSLRVREFTPPTNSDFVPTESGLRTDVGFLSAQASSGAGIAENAFYTGASVVRSFPMGSNLQVLSNSGKRTVVVNLEPAK
jgi:hypothetical protein